ncbi:RNA polymerase sigma-70 factor (ECF subfamily) [Salinibacterium sp. CAN_S4]|uniref:RNA polymerase sigma factor n=1 Tax=Salinibacterium sp. CAN_S4 TaxID=2787727 RepID=UPI0018F024A3
MSTDTSGARLEALVTLESSRLLQYFARRVDNTQDAADLVSETLLVAWRRHQSIPSDSVEARMWLYGVGRRVLSTHWRSRRRRNSLTDRLRESLAEISVWANEQPDIESVRDAIETLAPKDRELIRLVYWDGFTLAEAAILLRIQPATARSRIARARVALRRQLAEPPDTAITRRSARHESSSQVSRARSRV